jgi:CDP-diacylglycerol--glycerol-3-phosphate 3-phosphatidyltransferase
VSPGTDDRTLREAVAESEVAERMKRLGESARETIAESEVAERMKRFGETAIRTPANAVTLLRLLFSVPVLVWILQESHATWGTFAGWMFLWLTDYLDGWLARRDGATRSGAFLDPLADKVLVLGGLIAIAIRGDFAWIPVGIIVAREVLVSAYRFNESRYGVSLPARQLGKWKATFQFFAVALVLCPLTENLGWLHDVALWVAVAFSVVSAVDLVAAARRQEASA